MKKQSIGFTLIELLVVIAIIAILAAILFPVFAKAREKARQTTCASNEKQICLGIIQYQQDFDECFPTDYNSNNQGYAGDIYPYIKSAAVFSCPDDAWGNDVASSLAAGSSPVGTTINGIAVTNTYDRLSYGMNFAFENGSPFTAIKLSQVNNPSDLCMIAEGWMTPVAGQGGGWLVDTNGTESGPYVYNQCGYQNIWYSGTDSPGPVPAAYGMAEIIARHTGTAEIGFTDGHVKNLTLSAATVPPVGTVAANFKLWHPSAQ